MVFEVVSLMEGAVVAICLIAVAHHTLYWFIKTLWKRHDPVCGGKRVRRKWAFSMLTVSYQQDEPPVNE